MTRVVFVFLDGVGLAPPDPARNPFAVSSLPALGAMLDGRPPFARDTVLHGAAATLAPLDATLGVSGLPQSGTGQATLLTGRNAVALHGRHFGPWVPSALRAMVRRESVLARARAAGRAVAFANAYPAEAAALADATDRRVPAFLRAGPPIAAAALGLLDRHIDALARGDAVASEITNDAWRARMAACVLPAITPVDAGRNLAAIAAQHDLTFFAHYATDTVGHGRDMSAAVAALERVDAFLGAVLDALPEDAVLIVASDHGNIEDITTGHTHNAALGMAAGKDHASIAAPWRSLRDVAPSVLRLLDVPVTLD